MDEIGETIELDEVPTEVEDTDDGGAIVQLEPDDPDRSERNFYDNIIDDIPIFELEALSTRLLEDIERDKKSREKRDEQYAEAIKRTGLGKEAPGGAEFEGASKAVHPMLTEACVDFASRAIRELMPSGGPVKSFVPGDRPTLDRVEKADRKKEYMNWQFLVQMPDFRSELEQLLTQLPLGGSQFLRLVWDSKKRRPVPVFVGVDDVYLPYAASNFYTAERITYVEHITQFEFDQRVKSGMYRDIDSVTSQIPDQTKAAQATAKVEGKDSTQTYNEDGLRDEFEVSTHAELEEDYGMAPYRITIDSANRQIVAINRNWEEEDEETKEALYWMVEFPFVPWRGAYSIGLGQMIGSLAGAATGALRALLDSAHINNLPTLMKLKGANFSGQSTELNITAITEIEGGLVGTDDIRKLIMPVPYNPPSPVLFQLLGFLVDAGRGVVRTTFDKLADNQNANMPVGTTLALIEEGMKVMSGIHLRLYHAMNYMLRILHRIDRMYLTDEEIKDDVGEVIAYQADFELPLDVVPVADPEIFSDVQRLAQLQIIADRARTMPQIYNLRVVEKRILERTKIPNPDELLIPVPEPEEQNAVNENAALTMRRPVAAFPEQDHLAHIQIHLDFMMSPILGSLPIIAPQFLPGVLQHLGEHLALWYVNAAFDQLKSSTGKDDDQMKEILAFSDPETRKELDRTLAAISQEIVPGAAQQFEKIPEIIQKATEMMQQYQQPPQMPIDPNAQAAIQQKEQKDARDDVTKKEVAQLRLVDSQEKRTHDAKMILTKLSAEERQTQISNAASEAQQAQEEVARLREIAAKERSEDARNALALASRERINKEDNLTALTIAAAEIESGDKVDVRTGTGINPSA